MVEGWERGREGGRKEDVARYIDLFLSFAVAVAVRENSIYTLQQRVEIRAIIFVFFFKWSLNCCSRQLATTINNSKP